jgi:hypothetical protein
MQHERSTRGVLPIQLAVAGASPSAWRDGIVIAAHDGEVLLSMLDGSTLRLATTGSPAPGEPVAVHRTAELLTAEGELIAARVVA